MQETHEYKETIADLRAEIDALQVRLAELESAQMSGAVTAFRDLGEQVRAREALHESELRFRLLTEAAFEGVAVTEAGKFVDVSTQFAALFGYQPEEMVGMRVADVVPPQVRDDVVAKIGEGYAQPYESLCVRKDGTNFPVEACGKNYVFHGRNLRVTAVRDISHRKQAEDAVLRRAEELEALQATVLGITAQHDLPSLLETIVERAARLLGAPGGGLYLCEKDTQQIRCVVSYNTPGDYRGIMLDYGEGAAGTVAQTGEALLIDDYRIWERRASVFDQERPFTAVLAAPMIWQGEVIGVIDVTQYAEEHSYSRSDLDLLSLFANHAAIAVENARLYDQAQQEILERRQLEQKLEERRQYLERVLDFAPDAIVTMDPQHRVLEWNPGAERLFGTLAEEAVGRELDKLLTSVDAEMYQQATALTNQALSGENVYPTETVRYRKDGSPVNVIVAGSPIFVEGKLVGTVVVYTDITKQKQTEEALRRSEAQYRTTLDAVEDAIHVVDREQKIVLVNDYLGQWVRGLGMTGDPIGKPIFEAFPFLPADLCQEYEQVFETGQPLVTEDRVQVGDRSYITDTRKFPVFEGEQVSQVITIVRDVTEAKTLEAQRESQARQQAALFQVSAALGATLDEIDICQRVVQGLHDKLGYDYLSVFLVDENKGEPVLAACAGWPEAPAGWRPGQGLNKRTLQDGRLHYTPDVAKDGRYVAGIGGRSAVEVPLMGGQDVLGVLVAERRQPDAFSPDDFAVLTAVASQAVVALLRAREHQAVKEAEIRYQSLFDRVPVGLYRSTPAGELVEVNPALEEILGYPDRETLLAISAVNLYVDAQDRCQWQDMLENQDVVHDYEVRLRQYDGTVIWVRDRARSVRDELGAVLYYEGDIEDITEHRRSEEALRESEAKFRNIVESSPMGMHMYELTPDNRLVFIGANPAADEILGIENRQFIGRTIEEAFPGLIEAGMPEQYRSVASTGEVWRTEQIDYDEGRISGVFEVHAFQTSPGKMVAAFMDVSEQRKAEEELKRLKEFNESIIQNISEGIAVQDADEYFTFINPAAAAMMGYTPEELVGKHWTKVVSSDQQHHVRAADERRRLGEADRYVVEVMCKDGTQLPVLISGSPRYDPDTGRFEGTLAVFTDISERLQTEKKLARHAQEMAALYETSLEINSQRDLPTLLSAIVERASGLLGTRMGGLYLLQPDGEHLEMVVTHNLSEDYVGTVLHLTEGLAGRVAQSGEPLMVEDYASWDGQAAAFSDDTFRRALGVPLKVGDKVLGVINITDDVQVGPFDEEEIRLANLFADQAALAVENTRLFEAEAHRRREAETLQTATQALSTSLDLQQVFDSILSELQQVVPYDSATVQQLDESNLKIIGGRGFPNLDELLGVGFDLMARDNPNQEVVRTQAPVILVDAPAVYEEFKREPHAQAGIRSWLGVPLLFGDRLIGMLALDKKEPGFYTASHAELAMAFAAQAAIAIENARLFESERQQRELIEALSQATAAVNSTLDLEQILDHLLEQADRVIPSDAANITLIAGDSTRVARSRGYQRFEQDISTLSLSVSETPSLRRMVETCEAIVISDTAEDPGWIELPQAGWVRSYTGAPIHVRENVIGFLNMDSATPGYFTQTHAKRLQSFANEVSLAIANARLFEETRRRAEHMATLNRIGLAITSDLDLEGVLHTLYEHIRRIMDTGAFYVALYDEETHLIEFPLLTGVTGPSYIEPMDIRQHPGITGYVIRSGEPLYVPDVRAVPKDAPYQHIALLPSHTRSYIGVPLIAREQVIGALSVQSYEPNAYSEADVEIVTTIATQASIAIDNARLFQAEREQRELAEALQQATVAVSSTLELEHVLDEILAQVSRVLPDDSANIMLVEGDHVRVVRWRGYSQPLDEDYLASIDFTVADTPHLRQMRETGKAIVIPDTATYPGWTQTTTKVRSYAGAPIRVRDKVIGFLNINKATPGFFQPAHADRLEAFASQAGLAIENARFFRIVEQGKRDWEVTFDAMQDAVALVDHNQVVVRASLAFGHLVQTALPDIVGHAYETLLEGETCPEAACPLRQAAGRGQPATCVHEYRGRVFEVQVTPVPETGIGDAASPVSAIYVLRDITERKKAEEEIRSRNRELTLLNRVIAASAASQDIESIVETVCRELAQALDVPQAAAALFDENKVEGVVVAEYLAEGRPSALGESIPVADNPSSQYLLLHKAPLSVDDARSDPRLEPIQQIVRRRGTVSLMLLPLMVEGEVVGSLGVDAIEYRPFSDDEVALAQRVADQVSGALARVRLEEAQRHLLAAVEQAAESIVITNPDGTIFYVNPAFERVSGYSKIEAVGQNARILKSGEHPEAFYEDLWHTITAGQVWQGRFINRKKDGSLYTEDSTITPVRDQTDRIVNFVAVNHDVTREVQLEEQFRQSQKMEALGQLAGGIAHDFNNLLTVIQLSTRLLQRQIHAEDPLWEHVQRIQDTGQRAGTLTKQLLSFSRREIVEPRIMSLNEVVSDLSRMLKRIIGEDIELATELGANLWPVKIDASQVDQVILNLVINARDAMPQGGKLIIETANAQLDDAYAARHVDVQAGDYVLLTISDTGMGMDDTVQTHVFEPFFTTKERGQGTGLGLAAVFGIVKQNRGHIRFSSKLGTGTTFRVYLPRAEATTDQARPGSRSPLLSGLVLGTETILVVEDETEVRDLTVRVLQACGYQVLTAEDGPEALEISEQHEGTIHMLITDVVMPRMYGKELADQLQDKRPELRLLFMSGYPDRAAVQQNVFVPGVTFMSKPFTVEELTQTVRAILDERV